jgi:hypothetical protein
MPMYENKIFDNKSVARPITVSIFSDATPPI